MKSPTRKQQKHYNKSNFCTGKEHKWQNKRGISIIISTLNATAKCYSRISWTVQMHVCSYSAVPVPFLLMWGACHVLLSLSRYILLSHRRTQGDAMSGKEAKSTMFRKTTRGDDSQPKPTQIMKKPPQWDPGIKRSRTLLKSKPILC